MGGSPPYVSVVNEAGWNGEGDGAGGGYVDDRGGLP